jgi:hypothetical protein
MKQVRNVCTFRTCSVLLRCFDLVVFDALRKSGAVTFTLMDDVVELLRESRRPAH